MVFHVVVKRKQGDSYILGDSFTKKGANEIAKKARKELEDIEEVTVETPHGGDIKKKFGYIPPKAKLNWDKIKEIKRLRGQGMFLKDIAKIMGVSRGTISHVLLGITWNSYQ